VPIDNTKRIVDFGLLQDDESDALGNLMLVESLLRRLSDEGQDGSIDLCVELQDACHRGACMLYDAYKLLRERILQVAAAEAMSARNISEADHVE
jgi:hypothetical protein